MDKNDFWKAYFKELFFQSNNVILRVAVKNPEVADGSKWSTTKFYLASKSEDELYFYDGVEAILNDEYKYDENLNVQLLTSKNKDAKPIPKEKIFVFKEEYLINKPKNNFTCFVNLPLPKTMSLDEFKRNGGLHIMGIQAYIKDEAIELLQEKQVEAIRYDADQIYDKILEGEEAERE